MPTFRARLEKGPRGRAVVTVPFDPDAEWGVKAEHPVGGRVGKQRIRGTLVKGDGWSFSLGPAWLRDAPVSIGDEVEVALEPEGPQRGALDTDIAVALADSPAAAAFFDTLAQFYRKAYLTWIDGTKRRPEVRAERIAAVVSLLEAGVKERPR